ncbi:glycoside hydrolase family 2 [Termitidicoccus mucosus]
MGRLRYLLAILTLFTARAHAHADANVLVINSYKKYSSVQYLNGQWQRTAIRLFANEADAYSNALAANDAAAFTGTYNVPEDLWAHMSKEKVTADFTKDKRFLALHVKRVFTVTKKNDRRYLMRFGAVAYYGEVHVNGVNVGSHKGAYTPFCLDVTRALKNDENTVVVKVINDIEPGPVNWNPETPLKHVYGPLWGMQELRGGIWQDVCLIETSRDSIAECLISTDIDKKSVTLDLTFYADRERDATLAFTLTDNKTGREVATMTRRVRLAPDGTAVVTLAYDDVTLWDMDNPQLYTLRVRIDGNADIYQDTFGFRRFEANGRNFYLNGRRVYLFGGNMYSAGYFKNPEGSRRQLPALVRSLASQKAKGYNTFRTPHAPMPEVFYRMADEVGVLIYDEWANAFTRKAHDEFYAQNEREVEEWFKMNYNRASVVMYALGNEVPVQKALFSPYAKIKALDRMNRPVSASGIMGVVSRKDKFSNAVADSGDEWLKVDFLDFHPYTGVAGDWATMPEVIAQMRDKAEAVLGVKDLPMVFWESIGFSWGGYKKAEKYPAIVSNPSVYVEELNAFAKRGWGIGGSFPAAIGFKNLADKEKGVAHGFKTNLKRISEILRFDGIDSVAGFAPWQGLLDARATEWTSQAYTPVYARIKEHDMHFSSGKTYKRTLEIVNHSSFDATISSISVKMESGTESKTLYQARNMAIAPFSPVAREFSFEAPGVDAFAAARIFIVYEYAQSGVSRSVTNTYDAVLCPARKVPVLATRPRAVAYLKEEGAVAKASERWLASLGILCDVIRSLQDAPKYSHVVVSENTFATADDTLALRGGELNAWLAGGGKLLILEQQTLKSDAPLVEGLSLAPVQGVTHGVTFNEIVAGQSPFLQGINDQRFWDYFNANAGVISKTVAYPMQADTIVLSALHKYSVGSSSFGMSLTYKKIGSGALVVSCVDVFSRLDEDGVADAYADNLFTQFLSNN